MFRTDLCSARKAATVTHPSTSIITAPLRFTDTIVAARGAKIERRHVETAYATTDAVAFIEQLATVRTGGDALGVRRRIAVEFEFQFGKRWFSGHSYCSPLVSQKGHGGFGPSGPQL
jgi:hypothetical protein